MALWKCELTHLNLTAIVKASRKNYLALLKCELNVLNLTAMVKTGRKNF